MKFTSTSLNDKGYQVKEVDVGPARYVRAIEMDTELVYGNKTIDGSGILGKPFSLLPQSQQKWAALPLFFTFQPLRLLAQGPLSRNMSSGTYLIFLPSTVFSSKRSRVTTIPVFFLHCFM